MIWKNPTTDQWMRIAVLALFFIAVGCTLIMVWTLLK